MYTQMQKAVSKAVTALLSNKAHTATVYLGPTYTVRATRRRLRGRIPSGRLSRYDIELTLGRPNFKARQFIKKAKAAGEPFPIKRVQLTFAKR